MLPGVLMPFPTSGIATVSVVNRSTSTRSAPGFPRLTRTMLKRWTGSTWRSRCHVHDRPVGCGRVPLPGGRVPRPRSQTLSMTQIRLSHLFRTVRGDREHRRQLPAAARRPFSRSTADDNSGSRSEHRRRREAGSWARDRDQVTTPDAGTEEDPRITGHLWAAPGTPLASTPIRNAVKAGTRCDGDLRLRDIGPWGADAC